MRIAFPEQHEVAGHYWNYIEKVQSEDVLSELQANEGAVKQWIARLTPDRWHYRYAPGKWTIGEVLIHISDVEQMFNFRMLNVARGICTRFVGFDQDEMVQGSHAQDWDADMWLATYEANRYQTLTMIRSFAPADWERKAQTDGNLFTVRSLLYALIGHERHHLNVLKDRYA